MRSHQDERREVLIAMPWHRSDIGRLVRLALLALLLPSPFAAAQNGPNSPPGSGLSSGYRFSETDGQQLFANVCQACHMPDGRGATGAASYPSLVGDKNLEAGGYPVAIVVRGQRAMPAFGAMMSDDQIAAVVNYLRTHFGNDYRDEVTAPDVKAARPENNR
jgi:mono/diheme cytochrome c family protein